MNMMEKKKQMNILTLGFSVRVRSKGGYSEDTFVESEEKMRLLERDILHSLENIGVSRILSTIYLEIYSEFVYLHIYISV